MPVLTLVSTFYFVRSSDLVVKQLSLYVTAFMLLVVLSESIFGASFSGKSEIYDNGLYVVATAIWIFSSISIEAPGLCSPSLKVVSKIIKFLSFIMQY